MFAVGLYFYVRTTAARDRIGSIGLLGLVIFFVVINIANILGPPPPSSTAVAWAAELLWLVVALAYWVDRHRYTLVR